MANDKRSAELPVDPFDRQLNALIGLPNGAHTQPAVVQSIDFYGNASSWVVQTVKTDEGEFAFLTLVAAGGDGQIKAARFVLPPKVLATIDRQRDSAVTMVRRRHGRRLAEERKAAGIQPGFMAAKSRKGRARK